MVTTFLPTASFAEVWHDRTAVPSRCTVQAPQRPAPQPNLVPVICKCSRMTQSKGVSSAASTCLAWPLMVSVSMFPPWLTLVRYQANARISSDAFILASCLRGSCAPAFSGVKDRYSASGKRCRECSGNERARALRHLGFAEDPVAERSDHRAIAVGGRVDEVVGEVLQERFIRELDQSAGGDVRRDQGGGQQAGALPCQHCSQQKA